jgi:histidinol-phosphate/aromatic aminotransferase/cobyric acid decarboxylase-like protein/choline kinase
MKAVILAAGASRRMFFDQKAHKCLLPVGDSTLIDRMMEALIQVGVSEVVMVTGHCAAELQQHLEAAYPRLVRYVHNPRYAETNNVVSLLCALEGPDLGEEFLLLEADLIFESSVLRRAVASNFPNVAVVAPMKTGLDGTVAEVREGWVHDIIPPERQSGPVESYFKTVNIYKFSHEFAYGPLLKMLRYYCNTFDEHCYYEKILGMLIYAGQLQMRAEVLQDEAWAELDDPQDVVRAAAIFDSKRLLNQLEYNFGGLWNFPVLDFNFIRNLYFPTDGMLEEMRQRLPDLLHNYGSRQAIVDQKMATFLRCRVEPLIVLSGASQAYPILAQYFRGQKVLIPNPTFGEYSRVFDWADTYNDLDLPEEKIAQYQLVVIVNPNNPTGSILPSARIWRMVTAHPRVQFLVDESFIDYSHETSLQEQLELHTQPNLIVLKSLGKSLGVPGIRMGYLYTQSLSLKEYFQERLPIWNQNSFAEFLLEVGLKHRNALARSFETTRQERERFRGLLEGLPGVTRVWPSQANFLLVELDPELDVDALLRQMLRMDGIYLKDISTKMLRSCLRVAVRTAEDNDRLVSCWRKCPAILNPA